MAAAALGTVIPLKTFDGDQEVSIPAGTQSGDTITLNGLGATVLGTERRGDLLVRVQVTTPTDLTEEQRELLRQFAALRNEPLNEGSQVKQRGGLFSRLKDQFK